jgi:hypothetical protein
VAGWLTPDGDVERVSCHLLLSQTDRCHHPWAFPLPWLTMLPRNLAGSADQQECSSDAPLACCNVERFTRRLFDQLTDTKKHRNAEAQGASASGRRFREGQRYLWGAAGRQISWKSARSFQSWTNASELEDG